MTPDEHAARAEELLAVADGYDFTAAADWDTAVALLARAQVHATLALRQPRPVVPERPPSGPPSSLPPVPSPAPRSAPPSRDFAGVHDDGLTPPNPGVKPPPRGQTGP